MAHRVPRDNRDDDNKILKSRRKSNSRTSRLFERCILVLVVVSIGTVLLVWAQKTPSADPYPESTQPLHVLSPAVAGVVSTTRQEISHLYDVAAKASAQEKIARVNMADAATESKPIKAAFPHPVLGGNGGNVVNKGRLLRGSDRDALVESPVGHLKDSSVDAKSRIDMSLNAPNNKRHVGKDVDIPTDSADGRTTAAVAAAAGGGRAGGVGEGASVGGSVVGGSAEPTFRLAHIVHESWAAWEAHGREHGDMARSPAVVAAAGAGGGGGGSKVGKSGGVVHHLPYFSIIGAQKAGTTYLRWLLVQHPLLESGDGLHGEARGEPHFFDWGYPGGGRLAGGTHQDGALVAKKYGKMFHATTESFFAKKSQAVNGSALFFDTTPAYIVETGTVPPRIHDLLPRLKLIAIVRDPTDRYRSELQMEICRARLGQISDQFHRHGRMGAYLTYPVPEAHKPLKRGLYADQLEAWLALFSKAQLLVITSDELYKEPASATSKVLAFLGLSLPEATPPGFAFNFKAPKNAACARDMAPYVDSSELSAMRAFYHAHNARLPEVLEGVKGWGDHFAWLDSAT